LFRLGLDKEPALAEISDDELVSKISQTMWHTSKRKDRTQMLPELERYYGEVQQRGKPHLWLRARDCFNANQRQFQHEQD